MQSLIGKWKQPVYNIYDQPVTEYILRLVIIKLYNCGSTVVGIVSDMGIGNIGLWSKINIGHDRSSFFIHASNGTLKILIFADVRHLIKLLRNHLHDNGFWMKDTLINKTCFEHLLQTTTTV